MTAPTIKLFGLAGPDTDGGRAPMTRPPLRYRIVKPRYRGSMRVGEITGVAVVVRRPKFRTLQAWKDARSLR